MQVNRKKSSSLILEKIFGESYMCNNKFSNVIAYVESLIFGLLKAYSMILVKLLF